MRLQLILILLALAAGCSEPSPTPTATRPAATLTPTAAGPAVRLRAPETVTAGKEMSVEVVNEGQTPYVLYPADGDNCLHVEDAEDRWLVLTYPETCDVLMEVIVRPGEKAMVGSWDLRVCAAAGCEQREPVAAGRYTISATLYPYDEDGAPEDAPIGDTRLTLTAEVEVAPDAGP